jgi:ABC-type transporter Mla subunit MlaD
MAGSTRNPGNIRDKAENVAHAASQTAGDVKDAARDATSNLGQRASDVASNLGQQAQNLASTAADRAEDAMSSVGQSMSHLAGRLRESVPQEGMLGTAAGSVAGTLEASGRYLQEHDFNDIGEDLSRLVRQYPIASLCAVFGIGFMLGRTRGR